VAFFSKPEAFTEEREKTTAVCAKSFLPNAWSFRRRPPGNPREWAGEPPCERFNETYADRMALTSVYLAEEALALPPAQREELAKLLLDSLKSDGVTDEEVSAMLRSRLADLRSGKDPGLSFDDVFGEKA
jgi:putative addiction module component (TIGR02574 family)